MEADDGQVRGGGDDRRHRGVIALRLVDAHECEVEVLEEAECSLALIAVEPAVVAELDGEAEVGKLQPRFGDQLAGRVPRGEPPRVLQQHRAEAPALSQRL
jgi:hypothetical protein